MKEALTLALEAGIEVTYDPTETPLRAFVECWIEDLERFSALVRADEREACAKVCESHGPTLANGAMLAEAIRARGNT